MYNFESVLNENKRNFDHMLQQNVLTSCYRLNKQYKTNLKTADDLRGNYYDHCPFQCATE